MIGKAKEKISSYMNLATACFVVAYFQLMLHVSTVATIVYVLLSLSKEPPVKDVESMGRVINVLLIGQLVFPIAVLVLKFTIILIVGLHTKNRIRITAYVIFATLMLILTAVAVILLKFIMNKLLPLDLVFSITVSYALSIYLLRRYLKQLDPIDLKPLKEVV